MGTNASTNKTKQPSTNTTEPPGRSSQNSQYPYPTEAYEPAPTDPLRPNPRPARLNQNSHPTAYHDPNSGELPPTESTIGEAVNPWLDTSPIPPHTLPPRITEPEPQSPIPVQDEPSPRQLRAPPPYRRREPQPAPIYQPVRPRPYIGHGQGLPAYRQPPAQAHLAPPNRYPHPRIQPYEPRPRLVDKPYIVEPLTYRRDFTNAEPLPGHVPRAKPEEQVVAEPQVPVQVPDQDHEVASLLSQDLRPREEIPDDVKSKKDKDDDDYIGANLRFYRNEIRFRPHGEYIENVHKYWYGDYKKLENSHTYIQWLFPISEQSRVNMDAVPLRQHEANHIQDDSETRRRVIKSYRLMLDFYGLDLENEETGKVSKSSRWKDRFYQLKESYHNHFRITRVIRSIGELGFAHYQAPFVMCLFHEVFETGELYGVTPVSVHHWLRAITHTFDRDYVYNLFKDNIIKLEKDYKAAKKHEANMYYYETFPKRRKQFTFRKPFH